MTSPPWMPLYIGDFTADTMHLNAAQTGIYIRLLMHCWQHHVIPRDDATLCRIGHCDPRQWRFHKAVVLAFFQPVDAVSLQHQRVSNELQRALKLSNKRKAAAEQKRSIRSAFARTLIKKVSKKKDIPPDSSESAEPQQAATDEASQTASRDVATDSLVRSLQKRRHG